MTCQQCTDNANVYNRYCPRCCARFCLTLPSRESALATAEQWSESFGYSLREVLDEAAELKAERNRKLMEMSQ